MTDRYHVQVRVREGGDTYAWRRVHPVGGDPWRRLSRPELTYWSALKRA